MKAFFLKRWFVTCFSIMITASTFSQTVQFSYDEAGNRISRIIVIKMAQSDKVDSLLHEVNGIKSHEDLENLNIRIFPNPTSDIINIQSDFPEKCSGIDVYLFSNKGESLKTLQLLGSNQTIDLSNYSVGVYYLKIKMNNGSETWKVIKQ